MTTARRAAFRIHVLVAAVTFLVSFAGMSDPASASHFRAGQLTWHKTGADTVDFTFTASFRRDGYLGTAADGYPAVGDVITEDIGATRLDFGDSPRGYPDLTRVLQFKVTAVNPTENYLVGVALDPADSTHTKTTITHTYPGTGTYTARLQSCCTIEDEKNNASGDYNVESLVDLDKDESSPRSSLQPIVVVGDSGTQTFRVPGLAPAGRTLTYRLATDDEACDTGCTGSWMPPGLSIDRDTGTVTWDTSLAWDSADQGDGLWFASVLLEARDGDNNVTSTDQVTFLIQVVATQSIPVFDGGSDSASDEPIPFDPNTVPGADGHTPADGTQFYAAATKQISIQLNATSPDPHQKLHIDSLGLPPGATLTSNDGNPATALFEWSPTANDVGDQLVSFTVTNVGTMSPARGQDKISVDEHGRPYLVRTLARSAGVLASTGGGQTITYTLKVTADTEPPVTTATPSDCAASSTVLFKTSDTGSGVARIVASLDGGPSLVAKPSDQGLASLTVTKEGRHTLSYYAVDNAANAESPRTVTFVTDASTPLVTITSLQDQAVYLLGDPASVRITASDPLGLSIDPSSDATAIPNAEAGTHSISSSATDICGHVGTATFSYETKSRPVSTTPVPTTQQSATPAKKPLTRAQKLRRALKHCTKVAKSKRASCIAAAKKRYGRKHKHGKQH